MKRPSFRFYPADWRKNAKPRRYTEAAREATASPSRRPTGNPSTSAPHGIVATDAHGRLA